MGLVNQKYLITKHQSNMKELGWLSAGLSTIFLDYSILLSQKFVYLVSLASGVEMAHEIADVLLTLAECGVAVASTYHLMMKAREIKQNKSKEKKQDS